MDQSVLVQYVFILHESDYTRKHYVSYYIISYCFLLLFCCMSYFVAQF